MHQSKVRVVTYRWESEEPLVEADAILRRAKRTGVLTDWDADPGWRVVWIQGRPCEALRLVRDVLSAQWGRPVGRGE